MCFRLHSACYETCTIVCFKLKLYSCPDNNLVNKSKIRLIKAFRVILG